MLCVWNFLKSLYADIYEIWGSYWSVESELKSHFLSVMFIITLILIVLYTIKTAREVREIRKERKAIQRRIDKLLLNVWKGKDLNKEEKNI
jgi:hypothetical protein